MISHDALRMRLKRACEKKKSGKLWVSEEIHNDFMAGGAAREALEMALLESLRSLNPQDWQKPEKVRVRFLKMHVDRFLANLKLISSCPLR